MKFTAVVFKGIQLHPDIIEMSILLFADAIILIAHTGHDLQ